MLYQCLSRLEARELITRTMRSILVWLLLLSVLVAAASGACYDHSRRYEDIKCLKATLVATLDTMFEQLKTEIKGKCCQGNTTGSSFLVICFVLFLHRNACCCIFPMLGQPYSSCKEIYKNHK